MQLVRPSSSKIILASFIFFVIAMFLGEGTDATMAIIALPVMGALLFFTYSRKSIIAISIVVFFWSVILALLAIALYETKANTLSIQDGFIFGHYLLAVFALTLMVREKRELKTQG